jgi:hypothetical protein
MEKGDLGPAPIVAVEVGISRERLIRGAQSGRVVGLRDERGWLISRQSAKAFAEEDRGPRAA